MTPEVTKKPNSGESTKKKEFISSVLTCERWLAHAEKKEQEKNNILKKKEENRKRREENKQKRLQLQENKKQKLSEPKEQKMTNENADKSENQFNKNSFVIVRYESFFYPGQITNIKGKEYTVSTMTRALNHWKWPERRDELIYELDDIVQVICTPKRVNSRGAFLVPEMENFSVPS